jgi:hypothetical protein
MKLEKIRRNVFALTGTSQEVSALIAAGRLAVDVMRRDPRAPREAVELLERVLGDYDRAVSRLRDADGRPERPS